MREETLNERLLTKGKTSALLKSLGLDAHSSRFEDESENTACKDRMERSRNWRPPRL